MTELSSVMWQNLSTKRLRVNIYVYSDQNISKWDSSVKSHRI